MVCGSLLPVATKLVIERLAERSAGALSTAEADAARLALEKYAAAGVLLSGEEGGGVEANCSLLVARLEQWVAECDLPRLAVFGVDEAGAREVARKAASKGSPVKLSPDEVFSIMSARL